MIYAMFAMVLLTFTVAAQLLRLRLKALKAGHVKMSYFRLNLGADIPDKMAQASRNYSNLFEIPTLFYAAGAMSSALNLDNITLIVLSWFFVATRVVHSWIHLTNNNVTRRFSAFIVGNICILLIWGQLVWSYSVQRL